MKTTQILLSIGIGLLATTGIISCTNATAASCSSSDGLRYDFPNVFDICYTPDTLHRCTGWFTDAGSGWVSQPRSWRIG